jgi:hypothetical protein
MYFKTFIRVKNCATFLTGGHNDNWDGFDLIDLVEMKLA